MVAGVGREMSAMIGRDQVKGKLFWPKQLRVDDGTRAICSSRGRGHVHPLGPCFLCFFFFLVLGPFAPQVLTSEQERLDGD